MFTSLLFPFINAMLFLWSFFVVSPISRTKSVLSHWWRESRQSTPTNTNTVEINGMFASLSDEMEVMKVKYYIKTSTDRFGLATLHFIINVHCHCDAEDIVFLHLVHGPKTSSFFNRSHSQFLHRRYDN